MITQIFKSFSKSLGRNKKNRDDLLSLKKHFKETKSTQQKMNKKLNDRIDGMADLIGILMSQSQYIDKRNPQSNAWANHHGARYVVHHMPENWRQTRIPLMSAWLKSITGNVESIFEFGCNIGANLMALREINSDLILKGCDVNAIAVSVANYRGFDCFTSDITEPVNARADLVFSRGVLIHVAPENLPKVFENLTKTSNKFIIFMEHWSEQFTDESTQKYNEIVNERMGSKGAGYQFYGDYWKLFEGLYPDYKVIAQGCDDTVGKAPIHGSLFWKIYQKI